MNLLKLKKLANARQFTELELLWPDAVAGDEDSLEDLAGVVGQVWRLGATSQAEDLMGVLLDAAQQQDGRPGRLAGARAIAEQTPRSTLLRKELKKLLKAQYEDFVELPGLLNILFAENRDLDQALTLCDKYLGLRPGGFLSDREHLESGLVEAVDDASGKLTVSFNGRHQVLGPDRCPRSSSCRRTTSPRCCYTNPTGCASWPIPIPPPSWPSS